MTKPKWHVRQRRPRSAWAFVFTVILTMFKDRWAKDPMLLYMISEYSKWTGWMLRLIWVFASVVCFGMWQLKYYEQYAKNDIKIKCLWLDGDL